MAKFPTMDEFAKAVAEKAFDNYEYDGKTLREWAKLISTGDLVEVVRCKDCKMYFENKEARVRFCRRELNDLYAVPDGFCFYGERRTDK